MNFELARDNRMLVLNLVFSPSEVGKCNAEISCEDYRVRILSSLGVDVPPGP